MMRSPGAPKGTREGINEAHHCGETKGTQTKGTEAIYCRDSERGERRQGRNGDWFLLC
jgi:hypothetical protein